MKDKDTILKCLFEMGELTEQLTLCSGFGSSEDNTNAIDFKGIKYIPDAGKGFMKFTMAHGFPVTTAYGLAMMPQVIANSYKSLLYQAVNYEHKVVSFDKANIPTDWFLGGAVVDVDFPNQPSGGWTMSDSRENSPGITAVASFSKSARGIDRILGQHLNGRHKYSVSMEVVYPLIDCCFIVELNGKKPTVNKDTPDFILKNGWELIPVTEAPDDLLECFSIKKNKILSNWNGRKTIMLMGGLDKPVIFTGVAIVMAGAEKEAKILQMAASMDQPNSDQIKESFLKPIDSLTKLF